MPSWNEKPHVTPTINVNLAQQTCPSWCVSGVVRSRHSEKCPNAPVLVPLPLEPWRSVTLTVRRGECLGFRAAGGGCSGEWSTPSPSGLNHHEHAPHCPARPIRVTCSISGKDWPSSEVVDVEVRPRETLAMVSTYDMQHILNACRDLWALVKALVLGKDLGHPEYGPREQALSVCRDALYAALTDMAQHESGVWSALQRAFEAFPEGRTLRASNREPLEAPSAIVLAGYVQRLIEQVGVLP